MTLGELRRSLDRWADLPDDLPVHVAIGDPRSGAYDTADLAVVFCDPHSLVLTGDSQ